MKQLLIIGGSYFAGRVFVETLFKSHQYQLSVFNRGNIPIGIQGVEQLLGDRENPAAISGNIPRKHWDVIVDFCAYTPEHISTLLDHLRGTVGHYIFISTTSIYAPTQKMPIIEEAAKLTGPQPELGAFADYGYLKWLAEGELERQCREKGFFFTLLRPAIIYGRYNYAPRESYLFDTVIAGKPLVIPEDKNVSYSFVWVDDLADIIAACLENDAVKGQAYNVAGEESISYDVMADVIESVSGLRVDRRVMGIAEIIRERLPLPFPPDEPLLYDGGKLRRALNYAHTPFIRGMAETWRYYQKVVQRRAGMRNT
ncbi:MAG: NAD-dependent epimerase/dehydratase family protein [Desulfobacterales bacterium]|jgi:nucleoside-diphosphate-sugar epimerase|nr:NAD-dependent epimerase/dehydratase family protein [Desulfobacterales bacterium]